MSAYGPNGTGRTPGRVCQTLMPKKMYAKFAIEGVKSVQSYKGSVLMECQTCTRFFVLKIEDDVDPSCPACAAERYTSSVGKPRNPYRLS